MSTSIFLAKLMGPMFLVMGLLLILNPSRVTSVAREFLDSDALIFLSGILTLPAGLAIVLTHNFWVADWRALITVIGWIMIAAGLTRIFIPAPLKAVGKEMLQKRWLFAAPGALMVFIGALLCQQGYLA